MCITCSMTQSFDPSRHDGITYANLSEGADAAAGVGTLYSMEVSETYQTAIVTPPPDGTLEELADFLIDDYWDDGAPGDARRSWDTSTSNEITYDISGLTADGRQLALWAFEAWEMVADIQFVAATGTADMIFDDEDPSGAYASSAFFPGEIIESNVNIPVSFLDPTNGPSVDDYAFSTYIHEIGHALGLGHQGAYDGGASYPTDATFGNDSWQMSIMSYFNQVENTSVDASYANLITAMMADIYAIQQLYGAPDASTSATAGNTTWGQGSDLGNYLDAVSQGQNYDGGSVALTIYDVGGIDTLNLTHQGAYDNRVDLNGETFSDVGGLIGNLAIARGTIIENLVTGAGADTVTGNDAHNIITTNGGADYVDGGAGFDTIRGGGGNDTLLGGNNADLLEGGDGDDLLEGGQGYDILYGEGGNDTLDGGATPDRLYGGTGNDVLMAGSNFSLTVDGLWGDEGDDTLYGEGGFDYLDGGIGNDYMDGGHQADNLYGRDGNDTMLGDLGLDRLFGGNGDDVGYGGDGNDGLFGQHGNDTMYGEAGDDRFFGGPGNDLLDGGSGADSIYAGAGFDTIVGGTGDDLLQGDFNADTFVFEDGHGNDVIKDFDALNIYEKIDFSQHSGLNALSDVLTAASQQGPDVLIDTGAGDSITLTGVNLGDLDVSDFLF